MEKSKAIILECIRACEEAEGHKKIPDEAFDEDGELDESAIFCSKCDVYEDFDVRTWKLEG